MSTLSTSRGLNVSARVGEVTATLGYLPSVAAGALRARALDAVRYHRSSVLKHHGLPGGRRAQKMLAANLSRYADGATLDKVIGESFAVARPGQVAAGWAGFLKTLETGGGIEAAGLMAIPAGMGAKRPKVFRELLAAHRLVVVGPGLLVREVRGRGAVDGGKRGQRIELWGVLRERRSAQPRLGFFREWDRILPAIERKLDSDLEKMLTIAGQKALASRESAAVEARAAFARARSESLAAGGAPRDARKAAEAAYREVFRGALLARETRGGA